MTTTRRGSENKTTKFCELSVQCTECEIVWTTVTVTKCKEAEYKIKGYICGFCSSSKLKELKDLLDECNKDVEFNISDDVTKAVIEKVKQEDMLANMREEVKKEVKDSVEEEVKSHSWVDIVKKGSKQQKKQEFKELQREIDREKNIIMKGYKEGRDDEKFAEEVVAETLKKVHNIQIDITNVQRIGAKKEGGYPRPIRVTLSSQYDVYKIMSNKKELKNSTKFEHIFIDRDMCSDDQKKNKILLKELKQRREKGEICFLNLDKIVSKGFKKPEEK